MKVQTHLKAGITAGDVVDQAGHTLASAGQTVSDAAHGVVQGVSNLGQNPTVVKLWYWPFSPAAPQA